MAIQYPEKVQGGNFYLGNNLEMTTKTVVDSVDETISKTFKVLDVIPTTPELPEVTSEDNGDVLTVVSGEWAKATPSGGGASLLTTIATTAITNETITPVNVDQDGTVAKTSNILTFTNGFYGIATPVRITTQIAVDNGEPTTYHFTLNSFTIYDNLNGALVGKETAAEAEEYTPQTQYDGLTCCLLLNYAEDDVDTDVYDAISASLGFDVINILPNDGNIHQVTISVSSFNINTPSEDFSEAMSAINNMYTALGM